MFEEKMTATIRDTISKEPPLQAQMSDPSTRTFTAAQPLIKNTKLVKVQAQASDKLDQILDQPNSVQTFKGQDSHLLNRHILHQENGKETLTGLTEENPTRSLD